MNFISIDESAIYYEIGYSCDNGLLLSLGDERLFFTDGRYELEAREAIRDGEIIVTNGIYLEANRFSKGEQYQRVDI